MNGIVLMLVAAVVLACGYLLYGRWLSNKWGVDAKALTPARRMEDGKSFSPASAFTVFSHQFSSICGAGPVTGTIVAMAFGWLPVVLWVLIGGIFFGAVHDFGALYASLKNNGKSLAQLVVAINDHTERATRVVEKELLHASIMVQTISGKRYAWNAPGVGSDVFTQTCGVHADGDRKGNLYANRLLPERFGRKRDYALGKLSGKASLDQNLQAIGMSELDPELRAKVLQEIVRLGDKKKQVSAADLPFIIASILRAPISGRVRVTDYQIETRMNNLPKAVVNIELDGKPLSDRASGDGGYDAFVKALRKLLKKQGITFPRLADYQVRIPPGGKTDALVETTITWDVSPEKKLITTGVDSDQLAAAIVATEKMLNLVIK